MSPFYLTLAAVPLAAGYLSIGARHWSRMMGRHRGLILVDDPTEPAALFQAAWSRRDPRLRLFQAFFITLWPACLALGAINSAIESRRTA